MKCKFTALVMAALCAASAVWASKDTVLTVDPVISKTKSLRCKRVDIHADLNALGVVEYTFEMIRETAIVTTFQSGAIVVEHKNDEYFTPDWGLVQAFVGANLPTGLKAVKFWEAFSDAQP